MLVGSNKVTIKGDRIGPWKLGETLGVGSTGKVHLAYNESTNQHAAIKIISKSVFSGAGNGGAVSSMVSPASPDALPYGIEREIIIMKLLNHTNVLRLYDVWETNHNLYMVLEYAEKGELFNLLVEKGPLPEIEAVRFFRQIIIGMSYCHALGIVHRDLKPENILLDHKLNIKLADFGMAALETEDKLLETSCGSPHYAAPEIVSGLPYHGLETDVWSCGVILYALLTGRLPFDEEDGDIRNLLLKVQKGEFEMPGNDEISVEAQDLIAKILTVDPKIRIKTREILKHPLLQKHPSIKDSKTIRNLPREDTYLNPLSDNNGVVGAIDKSILQNLVVLWHGRDSNEIAKKLKEPGANAEKTLYALLHRFKVDTERELAMNSQLKKRQSVVNNKNVVNEKVATPPKKKNRASVISVSSSHKRPVSFQKLSNVSSNGNKDVISIPSSSSITPNSKRASIVLSSNKKNSRLITQSKNSSPTPSGRNRSSTHNNFDMNTPPVPVDMLEEYKPGNKRGSKLGKRKSLLQKNKRGSVTTKLISTYAKLAEDDDWEIIEKESKRVSSDFATLIDEIFEHEKYEQIRKEKEELERKVKEQKALEEKIRLEQIEEENRKRLEQEALEAAKFEFNSNFNKDVDNLTSELKNNSEIHEAGNNARSVSAPMNRNLEDLKEAAKQRNFSLQSKPVSRLDPGVSYGKRENEDKVEKTFKTQKQILETIRRSNFLGSSFDIDKELKSAKEAEKVLEHLNRQREEKEKINSERVVSTTNDSFETEPLPKNATGFADLNDSEPRKISDVRVPQFTRKSRNFSDSNKRLSVLSMYSSKQSFSNLADILRENPKENEDVNTSSDKSKEPEFLFEANDGTDRSSLSKHTDVNDDNKPNIKMNFADRFNDVTQEETAKLPVLPSLYDKTPTDGLGIYKSRSETKSESKVESSASSRHEAPIKQNIKSMIPEVSKARKDSVVSSKHEVESKIPETQSESQPPQNPERPVVEKRNPSFFKNLTKNQNVNTTEFDTKLYSSVSTKQMFRGLNNLLKGWTKYGLKDVKSNAETMTITGKLSSGNILSLRSTVIEMVVFSENNHSVIGFRKKSGSSKNMRKLSSEVEKVLRKEGVLRK